MYLFVKKGPGTNDIFYWHIPFPVIPTFRTIPSFCKPGPDKEEILDPDPKTPYST